MTTPDGSGPEGGGGGVEPPIPFSDLNTTYAAVANENPVTIVGGQTPIVSLDVEDAKVGEILIISFWVRMEKGATGGQDTAQLNVVAGTGNMELLGGLSGLTIHNLDVGSNDAFNFDQTVIGRVTQAGDFSLDLNGFSFGSDSEVPADRGHLAYFKFNN